MDPISQAVFGAMGGQLVAGLKPHKLSLKRASIVGLLAGMAADLDIVIRSSTDPLLQLEYHRQFTHSLIFIPVGALFVAMGFIILDRIFKKPASFKENYLYALAGYATHGLLDACTNYGTLLYWPFSNERVSWNIISIIDPLLTLPLIALSVWVVFKKKRPLVLAPWLFAFCIFGIGTLQKNAVEEEIQKIATARGHQIVKGEVKPSFANLVLWRSVYEADNQFWTDAIHRWPFSNTFTHYEGGSVPALQVEKDFEGFSPDSQVRKDIERFRWFSSGYLSLDPETKSYIGDIRFAFFPTSTQAMWGLKILPAQNENDHPLFLTDRNFSDEDQKSFWKMLLGQPLR